jgi:hypothetical protein
MLAQINRNVFEQRALLLDFANHGPLGMRERIAQDRDRAALVASTIDFPPQGLILVGNLDHAPRMWPIHTITPGAHPLKELAASLTHDARCLDLFVPKLLKRSGSGNRLLLVMDQFEGLFTACKDEAQCHAIETQCVHLMS